MNYLDDGVLFEILVRLPAKSLSRFKCVNRRWNSLISDSRFVKAQARRLTSQRLILKDPHGRVSVGLEGLMSGRWEAMRLDFQVSCSCHGVRMVGDLDIAGSCHGLMCIANYYSHRFVLYNPATMAMKELPLQPFGRLETTRFLRGLGYDALNDDYKLVIGKPHASNKFRLGNLERFFSHPYKSIDTLYECKWDFCVFSLRSNSWGRIGEIDADFREWQGNYSNGFLHWLCGRQGWGGIVSFDIATGQIHRDMLPRPVFTKPGLWSTKLAVSECGWLITYSASPEPEFLIMKDSCRGFNSTWTKLCDIITGEHTNLSGSQLWVPWVRNGKVLLCAVLNYDCIGLYDTEENNLKTIQVPITCSSNDITSHVFSLLPPNV